MKMLSVRHLTGGYTGEMILNDVSFEVKSGDLFGILGPNGSGKTTLLKMLSGVILLKNKPIRKYSPKELAKVIAVLPQHSNQAFSYTVKETVSLGRYAHQTGWFNHWSVDDEKIVQEVMELTGVSQFENQDIQLLSGGERQRVFLAQALAQEPEVLLLDEPTNHLDLSFQKELLDRLKAWTRNRGLTVISIFHDLNLAGLYCDRLLLLEKGHINVNDAPNEVLCEDRIKEVYQTNIQKLTHPSVPAPQMVLLPDVPSEKETVTINESFLQISSEYISMKSPIPLRTMSSGGVGSGIGWHQVFLNRHIDSENQLENPSEEMLLFLKKNGFEQTNTIAMRTAMRTEDVRYKFFQGKAFSALIVVTVGLENGIDSSIGSERQLSVNTWVFVNGFLNEEAFIQSIVTATEAKSKAINDGKIRDSLNGSIASRTQNDRILIAATQNGFNLESAGHDSALGELIGEGVYQCTIAAMEDSVKRDNIMFR